MVVLDFAEKFKVDHGLPPIICLKICPRSMGRSMGALVWARLAADLRGIQ